MKVHVNNEIGREINPHYKFENTDMEEENLHEAVGNLRYDKFEANVKSYPAPGIPNGTRECELVWQFSIGARWYDCHHVSHEQAETVYNVPTRQIYLLSPLKEQGERSGVKTALQMVQYNRPQSDEDVVELIHLFGKQVAEAVRDECIKICEQRPANSMKHINNINISDFIK